MSETTRLVAQLVGASAVAALLTRTIHGRAGDETFRCDIDPCMLGSGASWTLTGAAIVSPFLALAGFRWARRQHRRGRLGPFAHRAIPDGEELLEGLSVIGAGLLSWWLARNGPRLIALEVGFPNDWVAGHVGTRLGGQPLVPARRTWFAIGAVLAAPFAFSIGSMVGREWFRRLRRRTEAESDGFDGSVGARAYELDEFDADDGQVDDDS